MRLKKEPKTIQDFVKTLKTGEWKKMADQYFSRYIRLKYYDKKNKAVKCVTCGKWFHLNEVQAGHFVKRSAISTRFDEENVYPQCQGCNIFQKGNYPAYSKFLIKNFGSERIINLLERGDTLAHATARDYADTAMYYWQETNKLLLKNKLTQWWTTTQKEEKMLSQLFHLINSK